MEQPERKLTEAEERRAKAFAVREEKLKEKGYKRHDLLISIVKANTLGALVCLILCSPFITVYILNGGKFGTESGLQFLIGVLVIFAGFFVHEFIHGLFWSLGAENGFKDIEFGFIVKMLTPYCTCASPLSRKAYVIGTFMPMLILGIGGCILAVITMNPVIMLFGIIHTLGGGGDILVIWKVLTYKAKSKDVIFCDHPYDCGLVAFDKE